MGRPRAAFSQRPRHCTAPEAFVERLPGVPLYVELWLGRGRFEALSGLVRRQSPDVVAWRDLRYLIFDLPGASGSFAARAQRTAALARQTGWAQPQAADQVQLNSPQALQRRLEEVVAGGGEGLILHRADASHETGRSASVFKLKPLHDAEARVIAHIAGRGCHIGRLGALRVLNEQGVSFLLGTGFSDAQREHPPAIGTLVSYSHHGLTADGVPRFASLLRLRSEHF
jgi:DNA ligase-1